MHHFCCRKSLWVGHTPDFSRIRPAITEIHAFKFRLMFFVFFFLIFTHFIKIAITYVHMLCQFSSNLVGCKSILRHNYSPMFVKIGWRTEELWVIFKNFKFDFQECLQGKESCENWSEDGVINVGQTFCHLKEVGIVMTKHQSCVMHA